MPLCMLYWRFIMVVNYHQQTPSSLTFASPLAKLNLVNGSGVVSMLSLLKSTHAFNQEFSFVLKWTDLTFKLTHITLNHGAFEPSLGYWAIKRQNDQVKHYVLSSLLNYYSRVFIGFENKTHSFLWMTLSSLSKYVVFVDPHQGNSSVMPSSSYN